MEFDGDWKFLRTTASIKDYHPFEREIKNMNDNENKALQIDMDRRLHALNPQLDYLVENFNRLPPFFQLEVVKCMGTVMDLMISTTDEVASLYTKAAIMLGDFEK